MAQHDPREAFQRHEEVLKKCSLLRDLSCEEMLVLLQKSQFEDFGAEEEILTEGHLDHSIWVVLRGSCEVVKHGQKRDNRLALVEPGHVFGEMSFFDTVPHSASVRAVDKVETIRLSRENYAELAATHSEIAQKVAVNIVRVLSERLRRMDEWICELVERENGRQYVQEWQEFRSRLHANLFD